VSEWQTVWFAVMALAIVTIAAVQVAVAVSLIRATREITKTAADLRQSLQPLIAKVNRIADDAARGTALAVAQVERIDRLVGTATERIDETLAAVRSAIVEPLRQGTAIVTLLKVVVAAFRRPARRDAEDDDPLFVG
jgi:predicted PurR-regulated permease PerM